MGPSLAQLATQAPTRAVDGDHLREMKQAIEDQAALFTLALALAFLIPSAGRHPWPAVAVLSRRPYQRPASVPNSAWRSRCLPLSPACRLPFARRALLPHPRLQSRQR